MSNFLRKIVRNKKKDYKTLYETELKNRKAYETRYKQIKEENIELQKGSGLAELRKENMQLKQRNAELNATVANLRIELGDTKGFLEQEKEVTKALKKERTQLRKELKNGKQGN